MNKVETQIANTVLENMKRIAKDYYGDTEGGHIAADKALVQFIRDIGLDELAETYESINKWYS